MNGKTCLLLRDRSGWRFADLDSDESDFRSLHMQSDSAEAVVDALLDALENVSSVVLAYASDSCLSATLTHADGSASRNPEVLGFELERLLPIAVEDVTADFVHFGKASSLGVVLENDVLQPLVFAFNERRVRVRCVTPIALLAAQYASRTLRSTEAMLVVLEDGDQCECVYVKDQKPIEWTIVANMEASIQQFVKLLRLARPTEVFNVHQVDSPITESAVAQARELLSRRSAPWIDFLAAGDPFHSVRPLLCLAACAVVAMCLSVSISMLARAHRYNRLTTELAAQEVRIFSEVFPGQRARAIVKRLRVEKSKLERNVDQEQPEQRPVLGSLLTLLQALPEDDRYRLSQISLSSGSAQVVCESDDDDAPRQIVKDLQLAGLDVKPTDSVVTSEQFELRVEGL